jgi:hypothetical protein
VTASPDSLSTAFRKYDEPYDPSPGASPRSPQEAVKKSWERGRPARPFALASSFALKLCGSRFPQPLTVACRGRGLALAAFPPPTLIQARPAIEAVVRFVNSESSYAKICNLEARICSNCEIKEFHSIRRLNTADIDFGGYRLTSLSAL